MKDSAPKSKFCCKLSSFTIFGTFFIQWTNGEQQLVKLLATDILPKSLETRESIQEQKFCMYLTAFLGMCQGQRNEIQDFLLLIHQMDSLHIQTTVSPTFRSHHGILTLLTSIMQVPYIHSIPFIASLSPIQSLDTLKRWQGFQATNLPCSGTSFNGHPK
jgi:hypothetical protein